MPRYLKDGTKVIGRPYSRKFRSVLTCIYSTAKLRHYRYTPFAHWVVLVWRLFKDAHGTNLL